MVVIFSEEIHADGLSNFTLNESVIGIKLEPFGNWPTEIPDFNYSKLDFTWTMTNATSTRLIFHLSFS